jgi:hypothetical protein
MSILALPLAPVISLLGLQTPVTLVLRTTTVDSEGFPTSTETSTTHEMVLHQISGRDLERAIGGQRTDAGLVVFCRDELPEGAHFEYAQPGRSSQRWLIVRPENWKSQGGFYRAWAVGV